MTKEQNPVESTHNVMFLEEIPVWMTYIGVLCEEPHPVDGTLAEGAEQHEEKELAEAKCYY